MYAFKCTRTHMHSLTHMHTHTHTHARAARACIHMHNLPVHIHERLTVFTFFAAYPTSRSLTPEPQSPAPAGPLLEIITDEQDLLHLTGLPETTSRPSSRGSDSTPAGPGSALGGAVRESTVTAGGSGVAPTRKASHRRGTTAQDSETEVLYGKYLAISIELKEHLKRKLESDVPDADEKEKKYLELQRCRVALEVKEMEKEKLMTEMKQAAEIKELEKEKLKLEIQLLKEKLTEAQK